MTHQPSLLDPERLAFVLAHLEHFSEHRPERVLSALGHTLRELETAVKTVPNQLAAEARADATGRLQTFAALHDATRTDLGARCPTIEEVEEQAGHGRRTGSIGDEATALAEARTAVSAGLPFRSSTPGEQPPIGAPSPRPPAQQSGETVGVDAAMATAPCTPFEATRFAAWTVQSYAAFIADKRSVPSAELAERYEALSEQDEVALMVHFNKRFRAVPGLREQWEALVAERMRANARTRWTS